MLLRPDNGRVIENGDNRQSDGTLMHRVLVEQ